MLAGTEFACYLGTLFKYRRNLYLTNITDYMKKLLALVALVVLLSSCNRYITTYEAANGKARCGRMIR